MSQENCPDEPTPDEIEPDEARNIIDTQVDLLKQLNDELLRTIRVHAVLGGVVITGISFVGLESLSSSPTGSPLAWAVYTILAVLFALLWLMQLVSARVSYTDLWLGVWRGIPDSADDNDSELSMWQGVKMVFFPVGPARFENSLDREDQRFKMVGPDSETCVEHNNWILETRERYVNSVQIGLNITFVLTVLALVAVVLN